MYSAIETNNENFFNKVLSKCNDIINHCISFLKKHSLIFYIIIGILFFAYVILILFLPYINGDTYSCDNLSFNPMTLLSCYWNKLKEKNTKELLIITNDKENNEEESNEKTANIFFTNYLISQRPFIN